MVTRPGRCRAVAIVVQFRKRKNCMGLQRGWWRILILRESAGSVAGITLLGLAAEAKGNVDIESNDGKYPKASYVAWIEEEGSKALLGGPGKPEVPMNNERQRGFFIA